MKCGRCAGACAHTRRVELALKQRDTAERAWLRTSEEVRAALAALNEHEREPERRAA